MLAQFPADLEAGLAGKHHVENDEVELFLHGLGQSGESIGGAFDFVTLRAQQVGQCHHQAGLVFHQQYARTHAGSPSGTAGKRTTNSDPFITTLFTCMLPPCASTIFFARLKPPAMPCICSRKARRPRKNRSKMWASLSAWNPGPP